MEDIGNKQPFSSISRKRYIYIIFGVILALLLISLSGYFFYFKPTADKAEAGKLAKQGRDLVSQAKYKEAIPLCETAEKFDSKNISAQLCLLKSYDTLRNTDLLQEKANKFIGQYPKRIDGYLYLSHSYEMQGQFKEAEEMAEKATELFPKNSRGFNRLGHVYDRQGQLELAEKNYKMAIKINPKNAGAHHNLGRVYTRLAQPEKAKKEYELAKKYSPSKGYIAMESRLNLGYIAYQYENDMPKAIEYFKEAIEADPDAAAVAYVNLARSYYKLGKTDEAISSYRKAMMLDDQLTRPYLDLAEIYLRERKSVDEAIQLLEGAENRLRLDHSISVTNTSRPANINYFFAAAYAKKKDFDAAFKYLEKAFRYDKKTLLGESTPAVKINKEVGKNIFTDPLFEELRQDSRFSPLVLNPAKSPTLPD